MDTKSKNSKQKTLGMLYGFAWLLAVVSGVACGILASLTVCLASMTDYQSFLEAGGDAELAEWSPWFVDIPEQNVFNDKLASMTIWAAAAAVVFAAAVVVLCILTGRFSRNPDGTIHLNWFDRLWSEIHIAGVCGFSVAAVALGIPLMGVSRFTDWTFVFVQRISDDHWFGVSNEIVINLSIAGMAASILLTVLFFLPLVKKLKARKFWEKSLLGSIWLWMYRGVKRFFGGLVQAFRENRSIMTKVLVVLIGGAVLSATWIGLPVVIVLIVVFAPRLVRKFTAVQTGAAQVRNGNLNWKIPVESDSHGVRGEMDKLAADINAISDATEIAVRNELKNQRLKTELISNVSHDLKTPLTSMTAYVDLLKKEGLDSPNAPEYLEILDSKTQRLKVLTENLFEAAKASSGAMPVSLTEIDLPALVTQSLAEMEERLAVRSLQVIVRNELENGAESGNFAGNTTGTAGTPGTAGCKVIADGQLLWRVIENLLGNVSKYALPSSRVYINISRTGAGPGAGFSKRPGKILLEVKNISEDQLNISADELMERFKRGDESRNTEGSGLGLAIARDLVRLMKGTFEVSIDGDLFKASVILDEAGAVQEYAAAAEIAPESAAEPECGSESGSETGSESGSAPGTGRRRRFPGSAVFQKGRKVFQKKTISGIRKTDSKEKTE
ncbi:MAG: HAMP domain-containing sensor histidine kinase [Anaerovoracaceae bacterium]|nr:HAMP domain-containing sensor histidine kinase [Anaerovoracaceae bacterium]